MQVSVNSWHYRLIENEGERAPANLCPYMRRLAYCVLKRMARYSFFGLLFAFLAGCIVAPILAVVNEFVQFLPTSWTAVNDDTFNLFIVLTTAGCMIYIFAAGLLAMYGFQEGRERYQQSDFYRKRLNANIESQLAPKQPSVFVEWIKSIHNKTCARLEFVGPNPVHTEEAVDSFP